MVAMLERDIAKRLNTNRWWYLTLFIQVDSTHCMGKCIAPPLKKCFHHCSGITLNVIHPFDQDRTRYLTWSAICCSVGWRDLSRNACIRSCIVSRSLLLIIDSTFTCWKWCIFWRKTEFTVSFLKAYLLPSPLLCCPFWLHGGDMCWLLAYDCFAAAKHINLRVRFLFNS